MWLFNIFSRGSVQELMIYNGMTWYEWLLQKKRYLEEVLLIRQREFLFRWIEEKGVQFGDTVVVALPERLRVYWYHEKQWKVFRGDAFLEKSRFVLCRSHFFPTVQKNQRLIGEWRAICIHADFEIWESVAYYHKRGLALPLRIGLDATMKKILSQEVRRMMSAVLCGQVPVCSLQWESLTDRQDLDIAVWVRGRLRASVIMVGQSCQNALEVGVQRVIWDKRFSPLTQSEIPEMRIEMTLMSDLVFPIFETDLKRNDIDPTKGYTVIAGDDTKQNWYLPAVHNCVALRNLTHLLWQLAVKKTGIEPRVWNQSIFGQFATVDWIENGTDILMLAGPTEQPEREGLSYVEMKNMLERTVSWLCHGQQVDGGIPGVLSSLKQEIWLPILGCTGHALAVTGTLLKHTEALMVAEKIWQYMGHVLDQRGGVVKTERYFFVVVYYLRLSLALGKKVNTSQGEMLVRSMGRFQKSPILWLQVLSFLAEWCVSEPLKSKYERILYREAERVSHIFHKRRDFLDEQIALYPEYIALCRQIFSVTGELRWKQRGLDCSKWYKSKQRADGSWPHSLGRIFAYTRGNGKVFEVLACFPSENRDALARAFSFLKTMEYTERNTFFFTTEEQRRYIGGFRHDAFNRDAWIDASAHTLLGLARILGDR